MVVAQCYHMGPGVKVDPLTMLTEAKRVCDTLVRSYIPYPCFLLLNTLTVSESISIGISTAATNIFRSPCLLSRKYGSFGTAHNNCGCFFYQAEFRICHHQRPIVCSTPCCTTSGVSTCSISHLHAGPISDNTILPPILSGCLLPSASASACSSRAASSSTSIDINNNSTSVGAPDFNRFYRGCCWSLV